MVNNMGKYIKKSTAHRIALHSFDPSIAPKIQNIKEEEVAPVIHANWIKEPTTTICRCTNCGFISFTITKFCGNCGARIDKVLIEVADGEYKDM